MNKVIVVTKSSAVCKGRNLDTVITEQQFFHCDDDKKIAEFVELGAQLLCDDIMKTVDTYKESKIVDVDYDISAPSFRAEYYIKGVRAIDAIDVLDKNFEEITPEFLDKLRDKVNSFKYKRGYLMDKLMEINERLLGED